MVQIAASSSRTSCAREPLLSSSSTTPTSAELTCRGARTTHAFVNRLAPAPAQTAIGQKLASRKPSSSKPARATGSEAAPTAADPAMLARPPTGASLYLRTVSCSPRDCRWTRPSRRCCGRVVGVSCIVSWTCRTCRGHVVGVERLVGGEESLGRCDVGGVSLCRVTVRLVVSNQLINQLPCDRAAGREEGGEAEAGGEGKDGAPPRVGELILHAEQQPWGEAQRRSQMERAGEGGGEAEGGKGRGVDVGAAREAVE
mmetsp:Transcript_47203/g.147543  ORF Transcript_47203/g.147543 Transcript_47203/m.147543 type:complete len:257 (+) Transcript_47203:1749-2519(+)